MIVKRSVVKALKEIKIVAENARGRSNDTVVSDRLRDLGLLLIAVPEPFQLSSIAGITLCGVSLIVKNVENKTLGMKDVVRFYRRAVLELKYVLKEAWK